MLDNVQFKRRHFENRNKIRNESNEFWITVPILPAPRETLISEVEISYNENWQDKNLKSIYHSYKNAPYFTQTFPAFEAVYSLRHKSLAEFNTSLIEFILKYCDVDIKIIRNSDLNITSRANQLILDICKKVNARVYYSGQSGKEYLRLGEFQNNNIEVKFQEFTHPLYPQGSNHFIHNLSVIDYLFNTGMHALKDLLLNGSRK